MGSLDERPRYMPPEPMPRGGPAGAARDKVKGGRGEGPRPVCRLEDPAASRLGEQRQDRRSPGRVVDVLIRQGPNASGLVPCVRLGRTPARNGPLVSPGRMALTEGSPTDPADFVMPWIIGGRNGLVGYTRILAFRRVAVVEGQ